MTHTTIELAGKQAVHQKIPGFGHVFEPHIYFKSRTGLYVWESFHSRILPKIMPEIPHRGLKSVTSQSLYRGMSDQEMVTEFLGGVSKAHERVVTLDQIATMIELQPNGENGELLNNGLANIFYVSIDKALYTIILGRYHNCHKWLIGDWVLGRNGSLGIGHKIFFNIDPNSPQ